MTNRFSVSYLEVLRDKKTVSSYLDTNQQNRRVSYGSINQHASNNDTNTTEESIFHKIIEDMIVPKVISNVGNKVTKVSMTLLDGYDCYYTTMSSDNDSDDVLIVCFTKLDIPKILPIRVLSELKQLSYNDIESNIQLTVQIGDIIDRFHEELINYRNENLTGGENQTRDLDDDINDVIKIMNDNIDKFLERQERVGLLVDKTTKLNNNSTSFKRKANRIKDRMWWQRMKNTTLLIFAIILCVSALFIFIYVL